MSSGEPQSPLEQQLGRLKSVKSIGDPSKRQRTVIKFGVSLLGIIVFYALVYQARLGVMHEIVHDEIGNDEGLIAEKPGMNSDRARQFLNRSFQYIETVPASKLDPYVE